MKNNKMSDIIVPVVLFAYARPDHLKKTLEGLRINKVPLIYAFCDGAKDNLKLDKVNETRTLIKAIDWTTVIIIERDTNWGLGTSVKAGVTEVFNKHEKAIVIEDDIVMRPGAYQYTVDALNYFENDDRVMSVSMWSYPSLVPKGAKDGFLSERFMCWGWGTYAKYWRYYVKDPIDLLSEVKVKNPNFIKWGKDLEIQALNAKTYNVWYVGYALIHFIYNKVCFFSSETLVINIGKDESATNTKTGILDNFLLINIETTVFNSMNLKIKNANAKSFKSYFDYNNLSFLKRLSNKIIRYLIK